VFLAPEDQFQLAGVHAGVQLFSAWPCSPKPWLLSQLFLLPLDDPLEPQSSRSRGRPAASSSQLSCASEGGDTQTRL